MSPSVMCCSLSFFFFSSRRRHTRYGRDWSSDVCSSDLLRFSVEHSIQPHPRFRYTTSEGKLGHDQPQARKAQVCLTDVEIELALAAHTLRGVGIHSGKLGLRKQSNSSSQRGASAGWRWVLLDYQ